MKKKTKVLIGGLLFGGGSILLMTGLVAVATYKLSTLGLMGVTAMAASAFGLYYGAILLRKS